MILCKCDFNTANFFTFLGLILLCVAILVTLIWLGGYRKRNIDPYRETAERLDEDT